MWWVDYNLYFKHLRIAGRHKLIENILIIIFDLKTINISLIYFNLMFSVKNILC